MPVGGKKQKKFMAKQSITFQMTMSGGICQFSNMTQQLVIAKETIR